MPVWRPAVWVTDPGRPDTTSSTRGPRNGPHTMAVGRCPSSRSSERQRRSHRRPDSRRTGGLGLRPWDSADGSSHAIMSRRGARGRDRCQSARRLLPRMAHALDHRDDPGSHRSPEHCRPAVTPWTSAADGLTGFVMLLTQNPETVILDLGLPDITGDRLLSMIRAASARSPSS